MLGAVILAAGEGKRMGKRIKQLLPWGNKTIIETVLINIAACKENLNEIRVILGANYNNIIPVLNRYVEEESRLRILINHKYHEGMSSSVKRCMENIAVNTEALIFTLADKPIIKESTYTYIINEYLKVKPLLMLPLYRGKRGHPVIVNKALFPEVCNVSGPGGLRSLLAKYPDKIYELELEDEGVILDIDYYSEYLKYRNLYGK
jgi:molybdenum cofactor cytidylyltransferase